MLGLNGGLMGVRKVPTTGTATGLWDQNEQSVAKRAGIWPVSAGTDPDFANVSLLLPLNGTNGGTTFTDVSSNAFTVTGVGDAQTSTAQWKWDGSSLLLDGSGDYLDVAANAAFQFPGDFTIEAWVRSTDTSGYRTIIELGDYTDGVLLRSYAAGADSIYVNGTSIGNLNSFIPANSWTYVQVNRASNLVTVSTDGVSRLTATVTGTVNSGNAAVRIGQFRSAAVNQPYVGNIQALRITKGVARSITAPTAPFPDS